MKKEDIDENRKKVSSARISLRKKDTLAAALMMMILVFAVASASAADYQVREGESIQAAINMSNPGDTIIVHNGTYTENVVVNRSNILIRSANGSAVTIVQSNRTDMHVFNITDQNNITLDGFTIRDATAALNTTKNVNATSQTTVSILAAPTQPTVPEGPSIDGFLSVASTPSGADIAIDGRPIGEKTPHTAPLMPGPHTIKLTLAGYQDWTQSAQVKGGSTTNVHATLSQATGSIKVTSSPSGAKIYVDTYLGWSSKGQTPNTITSVSPGQYTIKLTLAGYQDWTKEVQVTGGSTTDVHATLSQATGSISVTSMPSGASISLDGVHISGITPYTIPNVEPGDHTLKLTLGGYQDWKETVSVTAGKTAKVSATLTPISGSATITSTPSGAAIYVKSYLGDSYIGKTPHTDTAVPPGDYTIKLTLAGYLDCTKEVQVKGGETAYVHATLTPAIGSISVTSTPAGATIYVEPYLGTKGKTPNTITPVSPGDYTITLTLAGYHDWKEQVSVTAG
ncbi:hypothetical protein C5S29_08635, partial [ANME-1 cluster archaeon GoMg3.2]|nr:hypothetical protein [ANME-1 cluster archaeon GoMg3.2]